MAPTDKRRHSVRQLVLMEAVVSAQFVNERCVIVNLSLGGAMFEAQSKLPLGERVRLRFWLPTMNETIDTLATVRWVENNATGVQFDGLRARETWALGRYLTALQRPSEQS